MKKYLLVLPMLLFGVAKAQDAGGLIAEAKQLETKFKEEEAFEKYKQANQLMPAVETGIKLAELSCNIGNRKTDPLQKIQYYRDAQNYIKAAGLLDSTNGDVLYMSAMVYDKLSEVEEKKEVLADDIKLTKYYITKAIDANPDNGRYYHMLGRWHLAMLNLNPVKKTAVKLLHGGLPPASIDSAIEYMEKCKSMEPYYCLNFYDLGRAYNFNRQYEKAMAVLTQLQKLPTRKQDDPEIKKQGAALLQQLN